MYKNIVTKKLKENYSMLHCKCKSKSRLSKLYCIYGLYCILLLFVFFFCLSVNSECNYRPVGSFIIFIFKLKEKKSPNCFIM